MAYQIYRPENGPFPPRFGQTRLTLQKTEVPGGNGAACLGEYLYLVNRTVGGGCLSILRAQGDTLSVLSTLEGLGNTRAVAVSDTACHGRNLFLALRGGGLPQLWCGIP